MLRNINDILGAWVLVADGKLGEAEEFYFDDVAWKVRYLVVGTGGGLGGRRVLISPIAIKGADWAGRSLTLDMTADQVRSSPDIDTEKTVTRRHERELHEHYAWPFYWGEAFYGGGASGSPLLAAEAAPPGRAEEAGDPHLQGTLEVSGYSLHAADGGIGRVRDFIVDDAWNIRYLVADTGVWLPGRKVLISPHWIEDISWETEEIFLDLTREAVRKSPEYDPALPVSEDYESVLYDHYGRPKLENPPPRRPRERRR